MKKITIFVLIVVVIVLGIYFAYLRPSGGEVQEVNSTIETNESDQVYVVNQDDSTVRFEIDEVLRGEDFRVVGTTNEVEGQVSAGDQLSFSEMSIDASNFQTDSFNRDGAIKNFILRTNQSENRLITLKNISVTDTGEDNSFSLIGDLYISGISKEVSFQGVITEQTEERINIELSGQILRSDFDLTIPSVPFVASVDQEIDVFGQLVFDRLD